MRISLLEQILRKIKIKQRDLINISQKTPKKVNRWMKWLSPGLLIKRWLFISSTGVLLIVLGLAIWSKLTPVNRLLELNLNFLKVLQLVSLVIYLVQELSY